MKPPGKKIKKAKEPKRGYRFYKIGFFALTALICALVYLNYDYWAFKLLIADNYIFAETLEALYKEALGEHNFKGLHRDFDRFVIAAATEKIRAANRDYYTYLYTPEQYVRSVEGERADAKLARVEALSQDTVYMYLPNISKGTREFVYGWREFMLPYKNLVLDLRGNYGGLLADFYRVADLFVEKNGTLGYERMRAPFLSHAVKSRGGTYFHFEKIVVLQDKNTASAAEGLINALRANVGGVALLGERTFGKGIGQVTIPLTKGYAVKATVLLVEAPDGSSVHGAGIEPDVHVSAEDDMVGAALSFLGE